MQCLPKSLPELINQRSNSLLKNCELKTLDNIIEMKNKYCDLLGSPKMHLFHLELQIFKGTFLKYNSIKNQILK